MKIVAMILFVVLLVPIYVVPWLGGLGSVGATLDGDAPVAVGIWTASLGIEAACYLALFVTILVLARGARWTAALVAFAATFDLLPVLDWIPLVPTVMLMVAFIFIAKAPAPQVPKTMQG